MDHIEPQNLSNLNFFTKNTIRFHRHFGRLNRMYTSYVSNINFTLEELSLISDSRDAALQGWVLKPGMTAKEIQIISQNPEYYEDYYLTASIVTPLSFIHDVYTDQTADYIFELTEAFDMKLYRKVFEVMLNMLQDGLFYTGIHGVSDDFEALVLQKMSLYSAVDSRVEVTFCIAFISLMSFWEIYLDSDFFNNLNIIEDDSLYTKENCVKFAYAIGLMSDLLLLSY